MRKMGTPLLVTPEEFALAADLLARARRYGMSDTMIADQVGVHESLPTKVRKGHIKSMYRSNFNKVMSLRPARPKVFHSPTRGKVPSGAKVDSTGTVRRMQALRADGFPGHLIGTRLGVSYEATAQLAKTDRKKVLKSTRDDVARVYAELSGKTPADFGIPSNVIGKCRTWARRSGYVPRSCWDLDTIDDPDILPEWTGECGTGQGYAIHLREGIPLCDPCKLAGPLRGRFRGDQLRVLREARGLSLNQLERDLGLGKGHCHHWEAGRYGPRVEITHKLMSYFDVTFEDLYESEEA